MIRAIIDKHKWIISFVATDAKINDLAAERRRDDNLPVLGNGPQRHRRTAVSRPIQGRNQAVNPKLADMKIGAYIKAHQNLAEEDKGIVVSNLNDHLNEFKRKGFMPVGKVKLDIGWDGDDFMRNLVNCSCYPTRR